MEDLWNRFFGANRVSVNKEYLEQVERDLSGWADKFQKIYPILKRAHDTMDDMNVSIDKDEPLCRFCWSYEHNGTGIIHTDDCILVAIRKVVDV